MPSPRGRPHNFPYARSFNGLSRAALPFYISRSFPAPTLREVRQWTSKGARLAQNVPARPILGSPRQSRGIETLLLLSSRRMPGLPSGQQIESDPDELNDAPIAASRLGF